MQDLSGKEGVKKWFQTRTLEEYSKEKEIEMEAHRVLAGQRTPFIIQTHEEFKKGIKDAQDRALRYNEGKPEWTLVDFDSLLPLVQVLAFGAKKYSRDNWKKPMPLDEILNSNMRHQLALMRGERIDPESGLPHIGHLLANNMFYSYHDK